MLAALLLPLALVAACDKVPLLAPTGSVITLIPASTTVANNSQVQIIATVIEHGGSSGGSGGGNTTTPSTGGTPVQNGTVVTFTTTMGRIEPADARTHNGQVTVTLFTDGASGNPKITAYSGGASTTNTDIKIGAAAVKTITLAASPATIGSTGGSTTITAVVVNESGGAMPGVPVTFTTDNGTLSPATATSDASGNATTTLTTTKTAKVSASAGATTATPLVVTVSATSLSGFSATPESPVVGQAVVFTVKPNTNANLQNVHVDFGDGRSADLGPISDTGTAKNAYCAPGNYRATATATDAAGGSGALSTNVIVGALPVTFGSVGTVTVNAPVTFSVTGTTAAQVSRYTWNFIEDNVSFDTGAPSTPFTFTSRGRKTVRVDVFGVGCGKIGTATIVFDVQ
jgi:adhesin/invasin